MHRSLLIIACLALGGLLAPRALAAQVDSQSNPVTAGSITIDGAVADWAGVNCFAVDASGDGGAGYDVARYCIAHDNANYYVRIGLHGEGAAVHGDGAGLWSWFDTDKNANTGIRGAFLTSGLGAEWNGSGLSQFNGWNSAGGHTGSVLGGAVTAARSADRLEYEYQISRTLFGVDSFHTNLQSEFGSGDVLPDGAGNYFEYHAPAVPPPPLPPIDYVYETNAALANVPAGGGVLSDAARTKLIDGAANNINWLFGEAQWVGIQDPAYVPANGAGDTELPQPRVDFTFDAPRALASLTVTYLVDDEAQIHAPDYMVASFSNDGGATFGGDVVSFGFDNSDDLDSDAADGAIRSLLVDLGGVTADRVRLDIFNDHEWTALGEVSFAAVPEPSSMALTAIGIVGVLAASRRRRRNG